MVACLIENRNLPNLDEIISRHMYFLPDWDFKHLKPKIRNASDYNNLVTSEEFWEQFDCEWVLLFQHDSGLLRAGIEEFTKAGFDYYGAPWKKDAPWARKDRAGGNGGLSLRRVAAHKGFTKIMKYDAKFGNEDVMFSRFLPHVAPYSLCRKFSVETDFALDTLGYHAIDKYHNEDQVNLILNQYD